MSDVRLFQMSKRMNDAMSFKQMTKHPKHFRFGGIQFQTVGGMRLKALLAKKTQNMLGGYFACDHRAWQFEMLT